MIRHVGFYELRFLVFFFQITSKPVSKNNLRSSSDNTLFSKRLSYPNVKPQATLGEQAFLFPVPKLWNVLLRFIRNPFLLTLERKLKTHFDAFLPLRS